MMEKTLIKRFGFINKYVKLNIPNEICFLGKEYTPEEYVALCFGLSAIITLLFLPLGTETVLLFPVLFAVMVGLAKVQHHSKISDIEKHLPLFLKTLAIEHMAGIPLTRIRKDLNEGFGILSQELKSGNSIDTIARKYPSQYIKRAVPLIKALEKTGSGEAEILELANEIIEEQELKTKEFNKKMVMYGLILIATSALIPGMFQIYLTVGSKFLEIDIEPDMIILLYTVIFPVINGGIICFIEMKKPSHMR